jgi:hypothetical protein
MQALRAFKIYKANLHDYLLLCPFLSYDHALFLGPFRLLQHHRTRREERREEGENKKGNR